MKAGLRAGGMCGSVLVLLLTGSLFVAQAQDSKKADSKAPATKKNVNRLPANYGKLNLSDDQKTRIYAVQSTYDPKIDELMAQVDALKAKQKSEINAVLTPEQLKKLDEVLAENKSKKQAAKAAKAAAEKPADAPKKTTVEKSTTEKK
jgi:Spy/CpxP family protein refolding chaperone